MSEQQPTDEGYVRRVVREEMKYSTPRLGVVTETFPHEDPLDDSNYEVGIQLVGSSLGASLERVPVSVTMNGASRGLQQDDLVMVQFMGGDGSEPVVTQVLYGDENDNRAPLTQPGDFRLRLDGGAVIEVAEKDGDQMINIGQQPDDRGDIETGLSLNLSEGSFSLLDSEGKGIAFDGSGNGIIDWESVAQPWGAAGPVNWGDEGVAGDTEEYYEHEVTVVDSDGNPVEGANVSVEEASE